MPDYEDEELRKSRERELLEEQRKKKRLETFFIAYVTEVRKAEAIAQREENDRKIKKFFSYLNPSPKEKLKKNIVDARQMVHSAAVAKKRADKYFAIDKQENADEIRESLHELHMNEEKFTTVAIAASGDDMEKFVEFFNKSEHDTLPSEAADLDIIRNKAVLGAEEAIFEYRNKSPEKFASLLGTAIKKSCEAFAKNKHKNNDLAMQWSMYTEDMLNMVKADPTLLPGTGLNENQMRIAEEIAHMGVYIREGLKAIERMDYSMRVQGEIIPEEENAKNVDAVVKMQIILSSNEDIMKEWDAVSKEAVKEINNPVPEIKKELEAPILTNK